MRRTPAAIVMLALTTGCGHTTALDGGTTDGGSDGASHTDAPRADTVGTDVPLGTDGAVGDSGAGDGGILTGPTVPVGHCGARTGRYFPASSWIYTDIASAPTRANSAATTAWLQSQGGWNTSHRFQIDTSFAIVDADATTPHVMRTGSDPIPYSTDCDPNVSVPLPTGGRIEGQSDYNCPQRPMGVYTGDCHLLVADFSTNHLFEAFQASYTGGQFYTACTIDWDESHDAWGSPPAPGSTLPPVASRNWGIGRQCTGPDAAGFPIAPLLVTVGDVMSGRVQHAIRFILPNDSMQRAASSMATAPVFVWPATHAGGPTAINPDAPIYGSRWRLRADFDPASRGLDPTNAVVRAVVYGLQHYGMLLADGGSIPLSFEDATGCAVSWDSLWGDPGSHALAGILPTDFDVIDTGGTDAGFDCTRNAAR